MKDEKKKVIVVGADGTGFAVEKMLNHKEMEFLGFADNDSSKWTGEGYGVFSVKEAVDMEPDVIIISTTDDEKARELKEQIRICRFYGDILFMNELVKIFDFSKFSG